jgi:hypothetical protein
MKFHGFIVAATLLALANISMLCAPVYAAGPRRPSIDKIFSEEKERKIEELKSLDSKEVFDRLRKIDFMIDRDLTYKAIYSAYNHRRMDAISLAQRYLALPTMEVLENQREVNVRSFNIAKKIFEVFPDESTPILTKLYNGSGAMMRGNIIRASGNISGDPAIKDMLVGALSDKSFADDEEAPEQLGKPLRVCDLAYNQIVLRYGVRKVLRTISPAHKIETRDHFIQELKNKL